ncbi:MAG: hypothetical protein JWP88_859 [Flaviaesturariibacter sp.]|nr:hypothetical protein [Flaviaesturariibacter sp.]
MKEYGILKDPFGLCITISESLCPTLEGTEAEKLYGDYRTTIERPAFVIELNHKVPTRYYCRYLSWRITLLIQTEYRQGGWQAVHCTKNPSDAYLKHLAIQGAVLSLKHPGL